MSAPITITPSDLPLQSLFRWAREREPVFWSPKLGYWVVTRYADIKAVFRDNLTFSPSIALEKIKSELPMTEEVRNVVEFIEKSKRGIIWTRR